MEIQLHELQRMANEKLETKDPQRKVRRVKKSSKVNKEKADIMHTCILGHKIQNPKFDQNPLRIE